jgi:hypothetical protein
VPPLLGGQLHEGGEELEGGAVAPRRHDEAEFPVPEPRGPGLGEEFKGYLGGVGRLPRPAEGHSRPVPLYGEGGEALDQLGELGLPQV